MAAVFIENDLIQHNTALACLFVAAFKGGLSFVLLVGKNHFAETEGPFLGVCAFNPLSRPLHGLPVRFHLPRRQELQARQPPSSVEVLQGVFEVRVGVGGDEAVLESSGGGD